MRRIVSLLLVLAVCFGLLGCGGGSGSNITIDQLKATLDEAGVLTSNFTEQKESNGYSFSDEQVHGTADKNKKVSSFCIQFDTVDVSVLRSKSKIYDCLEDFLYNPDNLSLVKINSIGVLFCFQDLMSEVLGIAEDDTEFVLQTFLGGKTSGNGWVLTVETDQGKNVCTLEAIYQP